MLQTDVAADLFYYGKVITFLIILNQKENLFSTLL